MDYDELSMQAFITPSWNLPMRQSRKVIQLRRGGLGGLNVRDAATSNKLRGLVIVSLR